ncbi:MAG: four helix bundle protein [bacterium]|nr:four helix bundle protein [bacterium]
MHNFRELNVWKKSRRLTRDVYLISVKFPSEEKFGLTSQIRRSVISVPSNIAEGSSRNTSKDFIKFLRISLGSCFELETQLILAVDLEFVSEETMNPIIEKVQEIQKMLMGLERTLLKES